MLILDAEHQSGEGRGIEDKDRSILECCLNRLEFLRRPQQQRIRRALSEARRQRYEYPHFGKLGEGRNP